jgi:hypothetical protein
MVQSLSQPQVRARGPKIEKEISAAEGVVDLLTARIHGGKPSRTGNLVKRLNSGDQVSVDWSVCVKTRDWAAREAFVPGIKLRRPLEFSPLLCWPGGCSSPGMSALAFKVNKKNGAYIKPTIVPANHSGESQFSALDGAIIAFFLLCVAGLVCLLLAN